MIIAQVDIESFMVVSPARCFRAARANGADAVLSSPSESKPQTAAARSRPAARNQQKEGSGLGGQLIVDPERVRFGDARRIGQQLHREAIEPRERVAGAAHDGGPDVL